MCKGVLACKLQKEHSGVYLFHMFPIQKQKKKLLKKNVGNM